MLDSCTFLCTNPTMIFGIDMSKQTQISVLASIIFDKREEFSFTIVSLPHLDEVFSHLPASFTYMYHLVSATKRETVQWIFAVK